MKKTIALILVLVVLIFAVSCSKTSTQTRTMFIGGSEGLEIEFMDGEPPEIVSDNNQDVFDIGIALKNVGEEDIEAGDVIVTLNGIDQSAFSLSSLSAKNEDPLEGKQRLRDRDLDGEEGEVLFEKLNYKEQLPADMEVEIRADVCYEYGTLASAGLCIKKQPNEREAKDICDLTNENVNVDNSGAPVKLANFMQRPKGNDKVSFTFDIVKQGSGDVFESGTFSSECGVDDDKLNHVNVDVKFRGSGASVSCNIEGGKTKGVVKLISGKRTVRCEASSIAQEVAYLKPLEVKLDYIYKDYVSKTFVVESTEY